MCDINELMENGDSLAIENKSPIPFDLVITQTYVQHSENETNRQLYEKLEMKRLGLPTQFSSAKIKRRGRKRGKNRKNHNKSSNSDDYDDKCQITIDDDCNYEYVGDVAYCHTYNNIQAPTDSNYRIDCFYDLFEQKLEIDSMENQNQCIEDDIQDMLEDFPSMVLSSENHDFPTSEGVTTIVDSTPDDNSDDDTMDLDFVTVHSKKRKRKKAKTRFFVYWQQRFLLFSRYKEGIKMDKESWYSVTPEAIARHIAERVQNVLSQRYPGQTFIVMDPFCGAGGNIIQFALQPLIKKVYAIDIDPKKIEMAKHNARIYNCEDKIEFIIGDFFQIVQYNYFRNMIDVCFYSPPWGGPNYIKFKKFSLNQMIPNGFEICRHTSKYLTKNIVMLVPRNFDDEELQKVSKIVYNDDQNIETKKSRKVELERNMVFNKIKTMTVYFGDTINENELTPKKVFYE